MANKCLRKCLLSFIHRHSASAGRKLHHMHLHHGVTPSLSMRRASHHSACLPLHLAACPASCLAHPSSSSTPCLSADEDEADDNGYGDDQQECSHDHPHVPKLKARSHSCSKLLMVSSFKSLLHRSHSHGRLHDGCHGQICSCITGEHADQADQRFSSKNAASSPSCVREFTWGSSGRHLKKADSFHGELQGSSSSKGKRAPKGHVAVYVDGGKERYVVPIPYLSHPHFQELLQRTESEFGFAQKGGLLIPCSLSELQHTLRRIRFNQSHLKATLTL